MLWHGTTVLKGYSWLCFAYLAYTSCDILTNNCWIILNRYKFFFWSLNAYKTLTIPKFGAQKWSQQCTGKAWKKVDSMIGQTITSRNENHRITGFLHNSLFHRVISYKQNSNQAYLSFENWVTVEVEYFDACTCLEILRTALVPDAQSIPLGLDISPPPPQLSIVRKP